MEETYRIMDPGECCKITNVNQLLSTIIAIKVMLFGPTMGSSDTIVVLFELTTKCPLRGHFVRVSLGGAMLLQFSLDSEFEVSSGLTKTDQNTML